MATEPSSRRPVRRGVVLRVLLILCAALAGGWALFGQWGKVMAALGRFPAGAVALGAGLSLAVAVLGWLTWAYFSRRLGATAGWPVLARVFFVGQLGKYLPGPGWPVVLQGSLGGAAGQPPASTGGAAALCVVLGPSVGIPVGLLLVLAGAPTRVGGLSWLLIPLVPLLALLHPSVFSRMLDGALRLARRPPMAVRLSPATLAIGSCWQLAVWVAIGGQAAVLVRGTGTAVAPRVALLGAGAAMLAYCVGMFAVILPAGLGVREGVLVVLLAPVIGTAPALAVALCSRVLLTAVDLLLAAAVLVVRRAGRPAQVRSGRYRDVEPIAVPARTEPRPGG